MSMKTRSPSPNQSASAAGERLTVKPLEWEQFTHRAGDELAHSIIGAYTIRPGNEGGPHFRLWMPWQNYNDAMKYPTIEEAKAAAQADFEQRILSALSPSLEGEPSLPDRCPTCNLNWHFNPPAKVYGSDAFRCVECKHVEPVALEGKPAPVQEPVGFTSADGLKAGKHGFGMPVVGPDAADEFFNVPLYATPPAPERKEVEVSETITVNRADLELLLRRPAHGWPQAKERLSAALTEVE